MTLPSYGEKIERQPFTRSEKLFVLFSMLAGFFIAAEYAATRPSSSAIFLTIFSSRDIPFVWLISVPFNLLIVSLYNRYLPKLGPLRMIAFVGSLIAAVHVFCALWLWMIPKFILVQFILKDIYILLMFKQLWSMIHSTISVSRAKYLYGCIFCMGTIGSIAGSFIPSFFAVECGSERLFFCTVPMYLILYLCYRQAFYRSALQGASLIQNLHSAPRPRDGFSLIRRSPLLAAAMILVILMQISVGVMDYIFNAHLEIAILDKDLRTAYVGRMVGLTNLLSCIFQIFGGFVMIRFFGIWGSHLLIPILLLGNALVCWINPSFAIISFSYIFLKAIDFSLFGVVREMLYIPMSLDEKFRAKAIIDVFAYRSSKALIAICILACQFFLGIKLFLFIHVFPIVIFLGWVIFVLWMLRSIPKSTTC